jgi:predicted ATP-grasp superfamily ATP-dependent carboligase
MEWLLELIHMKDENSPEVLVPCDEMEVRLLIMLALDPPPGFDQALQTRLAELVVASLGDPEFYAVSIDKTRLPAAAEALGIRVPAYAIATGVEDALRHAATISYPSSSSAVCRQGVAIAATPDELAAAAQQLLRPDQLDLGEWRSPALLVQAFIAGPYHSQALVAERGAPLASFAWERYVATDPVKGQTAVLRFIRSPETLSFSETLCRSFGMGGFFNIQFVIDARNGNAHLLEINRRIVTHTHLGEWVGKGSRLGTLQRTRRKSLSGIAGRRRGRRSDRRGIPPRMAARSLQPSSGRVPSRCPVGRPGAVRGDGGNATRAVTDRVS